MAIELKMPALSPTMEEGTLAKDRMRCIDPDISPGLTVLKVRGGTPPGQSHFSVPHALLMHYDLMCCVFHRGSPPHCKSHAAGWGRDHAPNF